LGAGFTLSLVMLGAIREVLGSGTLFQGAALMLGKGFAFLQFTLIPDYRGVLLAILPPGGFIALGFILSGRRLLERILARRKQKRDPEQAATESVF
jgi:electron transport complex protein RnfE